MTPETFQQDLRDLRKEIKENTELTKNGFETMNGRVKKLELDKAWRDGQDNGMKSGTLRIESFWKRIALGITIIVGILTLASTAAVAVAKLSGIT